MPGCRSSPKGHWGSGAGSTQKQQKHAGEERCPKWPRGTALQLLGGPRVGPSSVDSGWPEKKLLVSKETARDIWGKSGVLLLAVPSWGSQDRVGADGRRSS